MLVTVVKKADPSKVIFLTAVDTVSDNGTATAFTQDSVTYTFTNTLYKFVQVNTGS